MAQRSQRCSDEQRSLLEPPAGRFHYRPEFGPIAEDRELLELAPRSACDYGNGKKGFEHSIPPVAGMRYSITFRTLAGKLDR